MIAIARFNGDVAMERKSMNIENCEASELVGKSFLLNPGSNKGIINGIPYVIKFDPQDQFCSIVTLANIS